MVFWGTGYDVMKFTPGPNNAQALYAFGLY
jgi:hypothetical protein